MQDNISRQIAFNKRPGEEASEEEIEKLQKSSEETYSNSYKDEDFSSDRFPSFINTHLTNLYSGFFYSILNKIEEVVGKIDSDDSFISTEDCFNLINVDVVSFNKIKEELKDPSYRRTMGPCPYTPITKEAFFSENDNVFISASLECLNDFLTNYLDEEFSNIHDYALTSLFLEPIAKVISIETNNKKTLQYKNGEDLYFDQSLLKDRGDKYDQWIKIEIPFNAFTHMYFLTICMKVKTILSLIPVEYPINYFPHSSYYEDKDFVLKMCTMNLSEDYISKLKEGDVLDFNCSIGSPITFSVNNKVKGMGKLVKEIVHTNIERYTLYVTKLCEDEKEDFNSYVAINYDKLDEGYKFILKSFLYLTTQKDELLPLVHNGNIVAMLQVFNCDGAILFKVFRKF